MKKRFKKSVCLVGSAILFTSVVAPLANMSFNTNTASTTAYAAENNVEINEASFPDANFRNAILELEATAFGNGDGVLTQAELASVTQIAVPNKNIASLKGVELFNNLTSLNVRGNQLTTLDLSSNVNLAELLVSGNAITTATFAPSVSNTPIQAQLVKGTTVYNGTAWTVNFADLGYENLNALTFNTPGWTIDAATGIASFNGSADQAPTEVYGDIALGNGNNLSVHVQLAAATPKVDTIVLAVDSSKVTVEPSMINLTKGETAQLSAIGTSVSNANDITWKSADPNVVSVDANGLVRGVNNGKTLVTAITADGIQSSSTVTVGDNNSVILTYEAHAQSYGWMGGVSNGEIAGTTGKGKRLEAIRFQLSNYADGNIQVNAHVQTYGWIGWRGSGQVAGTTGLGKRMEAIQIKLGGQLADEYDVYYRAHVQKKGWMAWVKDGETAGTTGEALRMEAIQIQLVKKGDPAPQ